MGCICSWQKEKDFLSFYLKEPPVAVYFFSLLGCDHFMQGSQNH